MRRKQPLVAGNYYHIYNRGVNHQPIFFIENNWIFFLQQLRNYFSKDKVLIIAYCLMPNHNHLLVYLKTNAFGIEIMQPFTVSYAKSINNLQKRVGPLFQGPFKNQHVDNERYLMHLTRYIHLNLVSAGLESKAEDWIYSSYQEYIGTRSGTLPSTEFVLGMFEPKLDEKRSEISSDARIAYADFVNKADDPRSGLSGRLMIDA